MPHTPELSEARRALLEKYLRGDIPQAAKMVGVDTDHAETGVADSRARVVLVQAGRGSKRPFFFLHGNWKGTAFFCFSLARELGLDQPFYTLEPYRFDGLPVAPTVETMAAAHIQSMRAIQPEGPYLLGGWCNGGLVAYEMARQLHTAGQSVELLVLMDPMYLGYRTRRRLLRGVISRLGDLMGPGPEKQLDWFLRLLYVCKPLQYVCYLLYMVGRLRKAIRKRQAVIAVMGAANRDPKRFPDPDQLDICRQDNRHVAFAWASHFCFGAPLARIEGQIAFETVLGRMPNLHLVPGPLTWRANLGLRGLTALPVMF